MSFYILSKKYIIPYYQNIYFSFAQTALLQFGYTGKITEENIKNFFTEEKAPTQGIYWDTEEKEWNINIKRLLSFDQEIEFENEKLGNNKQYFREIFETLALEHSDIFSSEHESFLDAGRSKTDMRKISEETASEVALHFIEAYIKEIPKIDKIVDSAKNKTHLGLIFASLLHEYSGPYDENSLKNFFISKIDVSSRFPTTVPKYGIFWNEDDASWNIQFNKTSKNNIFDIIKMLKEERNAYLPKNNKLTLWGMQYAEQIFENLQESKEQKIRRN